MGNCLYYYAAMRGHMDIVKFLTVEKHCDPMCTDIDQNTPLHLAAKGSHTDVVKFLTLEIHCDPTSRNTYNATALHLAVGKGHLNIVQLLLFIMLLTWSSTHSKIFV